MYSKKMILNNIQVLWWIQSLLHNSYTLPQDLLNYVNIYGIDYGLKWIYFPDGDGIPHYVNLRRYQNDSDIRGSGAEDIDFRLYIGNDTSTYIGLDESGQPIKEIDQDVVSRILSSDAPVKIITHGWKSSADKGGVTEIKNAYIDSKKVTVVTVDWSAIADSIFYPMVADEAKNVGVRVGTFINALHNRYKVTGKQFHLIGHSLGAHVMAIAASRSKVTIDRITGLDPARPLFEYPEFAENSEKLDLSDANFVDIIHTCSGILGYEAAAGTVDFYPNSGYPPQPGCGNIQKAFEACSHGRSSLYFSESIRYPKAFPSFQCKSWLDYVTNSCDHNAYMGESVDRNLRGVYYLRTNSYRPFGQRS